MGDQLFVKVKREQISVGRREDESGKPNYQLNELQSIGKVDRALKRSDRFKPFPTATDRKLKGNGAPTVGQYGEGTKRLTCSRER